MPEMAKLSPIQVEILSDTLRKMATQIAWFDPKIFAEDMHVVQESLTKEFLAVANAADIKPLDHLLFSSLHCSPESRSLRNEKANPLRFSVVLSRTKVTRTGFLRTVAQRDLATKTLFRLLAKRQGVR